jgi:rhamnosyltransferase
MHTLNDEEVIDRSLQAILDQTYPVDEIVVVDNGSSDNTLAKLLSKPVRLIRHGQNLGTSGAVVTGLKYALAKGYDWIWIFDADSAPRKDALERLMELYESFPPDIRERVWLLASHHVEARAQPGYEMLFTPKGFRHARPTEDHPFYEFDSTIWSGSLYKLDAVRKVGLPHLDYVLDWGEHEFGYRGRRAGYRAFVHAESIVDHNIGGGGALGFTSYKLGPLRFRMRELPPIRCYYLVRNLLYFWCYEYHDRNVRVLTICFLRVAKLTACFLLRLPSRRREFWACARGIVHGLAGKIDRRF